MTVHSHWLRAPVDAPARTALAAGCEVDVCIVGAGLTGLWTAYALARADPALDVLVLEREHVGFGASGRNGGWLMGEAPGGRAIWERRGGRAAGVAMEQAMREAVEEVRSVLALEGIECDFHIGGSLCVAQKRPQLQRLRAAVEDDSRLLTAEEAWDRIAVNRVLGARYTPHCARVHPGRLVQGLAAAAERRGVRIAERTPVTRIAPRVATTPVGDVRARWVVRATEAYTSDLPGLKRVLAPVNSSMLITAPLDASAWQALGWAGRETLVDGAHAYVYLQRTADDRIAIGGRGSPYRFGSRTDREDPVPARTRRALHSRLAALFPLLSDVEVSAAWHGVLGVSRTWRPAVGVDPRTGLAWAGGYVGDGLAASNVAGRTLRDLLLGERTPLTRLPWVTPFEARWEPEPARYVGIHTVYRLLRVADALERWTERPSGLAAVVNRLAGR